MATHGGTVEWSRGDAAFTDLKYSRAHRCSFDGGAQVKASSSPHSVPLPYSDASGVAPEEALVAALASCHMLWFLSLAAEARMGRFIGDSIRGEVRVQGRWSAA